MHNYDHDSIHELLIWAKNMLDNKSYPVVPYQINRSTQIIDCKCYLESSIATISKYWENPTFYPCIDHLWEFRNSLNK